MDKKSNINSNDSLFNEENLSRSYKKKSPYFFNDPKLSKLVEQNNINLKINLSRIKDLKELKEINIKKPDMYELKRKYLDNDTLSENQINNRDYFDDDYY